MFRVLLFIPEKWLIRYIRNRNVVKVDSSCSKNKICYNIDEGSNAFSVQALKAVDIRKSVKYPNHGRLSDGVTTTSKVVDSRESVKFPNHSHLSDGLTASRKLVT